MSRENLVVWLNLWHGWTQWTQKCYPRHGFSCPFSSALAFPSRHLWALISWLPKSYCPLCPIQRKIDLCCGGTYQNLGTRPCHWSNWVVCLALNPPVSRGKGTTAQRGHLRSQLCSWSSVPATQSTWLRTGEEWSTEEIWGARPRSRRQWVHWKLCRLALTQILLVSLWLEHVSENESSFT